MEDPYDLMELIEKLDECCYESNTKDYLIKMIQTIMNYPNRGNKAENYVENLYGNKIIIIYYSMGISIYNKKYNVPIKIVLMKDIPNEPPKFFIPMKECIGINKNNKDIDQTTFRIMTKTLRSWNQFSNIETVLEEIYESFISHFPIYLKKN